MALGLGVGLAKTGLVTPGIVTDSLVMKHMYPAGGVQPLSDGAAYFDGSTSYVSAATLTFTDSMSFCCWVRSDASASGTIISSREDASNAVTIGISSNVVDARFVGANTLQRVSTAWTHQAWNHIACVCDSGTATTGLSIYINGALDNGATSNAFPIPTHALTHIGIKRSGSSSYNSDFEGHVCNVGVWNDLLTQPEIKSIMWKQYAGLSTTEKTSLVSWWNLDVETNTSGESGTGGVKDHHGSNHGTLS